VEVFADAGNFFKLTPTRHLGQVFFEVAEQTGGAFVGERAEAVCALEGQHTRHLLKNISYLFVDHSSH
jgi:hypothetical protein